MTEAPTPEAQAEANVETSTIQHRAGQFGIVPVSVSTHPRLGALAVRLYAILHGKYASRGSGTCYPSRATLAADMNLSKHSVKQVDTAIKELVDIGAITVEKRRKSNQALTSSLYTIEFLIPMANTPYPSGENTTTLVVKTPQPPRGENTTRTRIKNKNQNQGRGETLAAAHATAALPSSDDVDFSDILAEAPITAVDVRTLWNQLCAPAGLPESKGWTANLKRHIDVRLREHPSREWWVATFTRIAASDFLRGQNDRAWKSNLLWFMDSPTNLLKLEEGNYDNRTAPVARPALKLDVQATATPDLDAVQRTIARRSTVLERIDQFPLDAQQALTQLAVAQIAPEWRGATDTPLYYNSVKGRMVAILMTYGETLDAAVEHFLGAERARAVAS